MKRDLTNGMVWAERFEPDPNDADAVAYRLWKDQKNRQNCQRRERKRKRQEEEAAAAAARVVPQRVARGGSPVEAAAESEEEATLSELEAPKHNSKHNLPKHNLLRRKS